MTEDCSNRATSAEDLLAAVELRRQLAGSHAELERVRGQLAQAERDYDLNWAASLRHGKLPELQRKLEAAEARLASKQGEHRLLHAVVTVDGLGATYRSGDTASLAVAVTDVVARYPDTVAAVAAAQGRFRWDHDGAALVQAYAALPTPRPTRGAGARSATASGAV